MQPSEYADTRGLRHALAGSEADFARRLGIVVVDVLRGVSVPDWAADAGTGRAGEAPAPIRKAVPGHRTVTCKAMYECDSDATGCWPG
jgi:hypothetical protein